MRISLSLFLSKRFWITAICVAILALIFVLRSSAVRVIVENLTPPSLPKYIQPEKREYLAQNWDEKTSEQFHHISQGTGTLPIPYDWLVALEQPEKSVWGLLWPSREGAFTDPDYIQRYGFISGTTSAHNPDGLPIGFAGTAFQNVSGYPTLTTSGGFTCAACHTGKFTQGDTEYIVNGGPAVTDLNALTKGLGSALGQTLIASKLPLPNKRFNRFAKAVLGDTYTQTAKAQLAKDLESVVNAVAATGGDVIDVAEGFGRLDALNRIGNQVFSTNTKQRENYAPIDAPVNYPHIWTSSWFDWVQYDGSIMQPLVRNSGEALGVHAAINTTAPKGEGRFSSSVPVKNLKWIEDSLAGDKNPMQAGAFGGLHGPTWPASLGTIDTALAAKGQALYERRCMGCHLPALNSDEIFTERYFKPIEYIQNGQQKKTPEAFLAVNILPLRVIGTDSAQADILAKRTVNTTGGTTGKSMGIDATVCTPLPDFGAGNPRLAKARLDTAVTQRTKSGENQLVEVDVTDGPMVSFALALGAVVQQVNDQWFDQNFIPEELRPYFEGERPNCLQSGAGYKARPLNGVWATGPFLHNGSVPTLDDLLRPVDQRPEFVRLGTLEFDVQKVGVKQPILDKSHYPLYQDGLFILDTKLDGNRNTGHAFGASANGDKTGVIGPEFTDQERAAIIEYLKTL